MYFCENLQVKRLKICDFIKVLAPPPLETASKNRWYFGMVGGVGLSFTAPLGGTYTKLAGHLAFEKYTFKHIASPLLSTPGRKKALKNSSIFMFFCIFHNFYWYFVNFCISIFYFLVQPKKTGAHSKHF